MKRLNKIGLILTVFLLMGISVAFAGEKTGTVTMKTSSVDKKGRTDIKVYLDTTGNGMTDTMLSFQIVDGKEHTVALEGLEDLIQEGSRITFDDTNMQSPTGFYKLIIWHDLITIDGKSLIQLYPNPYWFPFSFAKSQS
ncbi:hypothetical protein FACS1894172_15840 [Spirochaetia bacterium]|nr:hypothetical protein FACS1894164_10660 [Spirochaetia bacterium]GHU34900.1 hypothetical protein FACS1894172_15840 [Spirochaetia bacterium]